MHKTKTHFEQVPLAVVEKIAAKDAAQARSAPGRPLAKGPVLKK